MANHTPTTIRKITTLVTLIWLEVGNKTGKLVQVFCISELWQDDRRICASEPSDINDYAETLVV
jgi:hypothetical protein